MLAKCDNYQGWKTANIDNIRIETNGMPVKEAYSRFNRAFGDELFPANLKQYEMAERIAEVVGNYRNIYENPYNMDIDLATQFAANDIMNSVFATPDSFAFDNANLDSVYDTINNRRGKLVEAIGTAYEKGEDIDITTTEEFRKAQTIETETDDGVDYRHANLNPEEWKTTKTKGKGTILRKGRFERRMYSVHSTETTRVSASSSATISRLPVMNSVTH